jgi:hypothetical protein
MTIDDKGNLIVNIDGKTHYITRKEIENAFLIPIKTKQNTKRINFQRFQKKK